MISQRFSGKIMLVSPLPEKRLIPSLTVCVRPLSKVKSVSSLLEENAPSSINVTVLGTVNEENELEVNADLPIVSRLLSLAIVSVERVLTLPNALSPITFKEDGNGRKNGNLFERALAYFFKSFGKNEFF